MFSCKQNDVIMHRQANSKLLMTFPGRFTESESESVDGKASSVTTNTRIRNQGLMRGRISEELLEGLSQQVSLGYT